MKKSSLLFLAIASVISFVGISFAGVSIGGVNIDGRQYGGIHLESGSVNGPIHQSEEFHMNGGGRMDYRENSPNSIQRRDNIFVPNIEIGEDQSPQVEDTPISEVLRNVYDYIGLCNVYREEGRIKIMIGKIGPESPSMYLCKAIEEFCLGISQKNISFQDEKNQEWILLKNKEGDVFIQERRSP